MSGKITDSAKYYLRLYEKKSSELSPTYQLNAFPLSQSWESGTGYTTQNPNNKDGASWVRSNENFNNTNWSLKVTPVTFNQYNSAFNSASSYFRTYGAESGSRPTTGGGVWYVNESDEDVYSLGNGYEASQSFSYESPDINMDVTGIVKRWLDTSIPNNGLILKWNDVQENSSDFTGDMNFFSINANSIYSPKIEARWDSHTTIGNTGLTEITNDGTQDNYLYMINLRNTYKETETPKFRVGGRKRYQNKSVSRTKSTTYPMGITEGSGSYSIIDIATGTTIVPFGDYTLLSSDSGSNYFKQNLKGFINDRSYRVLLRLKLNDIFIFIYE